MSETDESLLRSFATTRDGDAFRLLAERYLGLIFHAALRRTGNRQLAEEASQNVLCALARKAGPLAAHPERLAAWLHRAAIYESTKAMRSEASHQRRRNLRHPDDIPATGDSAVSPWAAALPHLDAALDRLPEEDRTVLLLHYFENQALPRIADTLGKSRVAVQKQAQRALQKLSRLLRAKGVVLPAAAVAAGMSAEAAKAAPLHLLSSAVPAALAVPAAPSTFSLPLLMKSKAAIPLVVLACVAPLAFQQHGISKATRENERLRGLAATTGRPIVSRNHATPLPAGLSASQDIYVLLEESDRASLSGVGEIFQSKLDGLPPETLVRLVRECANLQAHSDRKHLLFSQLFNALARSSPRLALDTTIDAVEDPEALFRLMDQSRISEGLFRWASADPDAAFEWYLARSGDPKLQPFSTGVPSFLRELAPRLLLALVSAGHPGTAAILSGKDERDRFDLIRDSIQHAQFHPSFSSGSSDLRAEKLQTRANYFSLIREQNFSDAHQLEALELLGTGLSLDLASFLQLVEITPEETETLLASIVRQNLFTRRMPFDPAREKLIEEEAAALLRKFLPGQADAIFAGIAEEAARNRSTHARQLLDQLKAQPSITDQQLARELTGRDLRSHTEEAIEQAQRIQNPDLRQSTLETLRRR